MALGNSWNRCRQPIELPYYKAVPLQSVGGFVIPPARFINSQTSRAHLRTRTITSSLATTSSGYQLLAPSSDQRKNIFRDLYAVAGFDRNIEGRIGLNLFCIDDHYF